MTIKQGVTRDNVSAGAVPREALAAQARRLRTEGLSVAQIRERLGVGKYAIEKWTVDIPIPEWTRRPNAKDDLREQATALREAGATVNEIAARLGVATSTAWTWVKHLPLNPDPELAEKRRRHSKVMTDARWSRHNRERDVAHEAAKTNAAAQVGALSDREVRLIGAAIYWCEGGKSKPWRREERLSFINSDPDIIRLFLRYLVLSGVPREMLTVRLSIHETADVVAATDWWSRQIDIPVAQFRPATLKKHKPATIRHNLGNDYHGCLIVYVRQSRLLYWEVEGIMRGLAEHGRGLQFP